MLADAQRAVVEEDYEFLSLLFACSSAVELVTRGTGAMHHVLNNLDETIRLRDPAEEMGNEEETDWRLRLLEALSSPGAERATASLLAEVPGWERRCVEASSVPSGART